MKVQKWMQSETFLSKLSKEVQIPLKRGGNQAFIKFKRTDAVSNLNLCVVFLISKGMNAKQIAKELLMTKSQLSYYLSSLKKQNVIKNIAYGVWEVNSQSPPKRSSNFTPTPLVQILGGRGFKPVNSDTVKKETRGHGFSIQFRIRKNIRNWNKRGEILQKNFRELKPKKINGGYKIHFHDHKIHLFNQSIIIHSSLSFVSEKASETRDSAINYFLKIIKKLEYLFGCENQFKYENKYTFKFNREHYALMKSIVAKHFNSNGKKIRIADEYGVWCIIDESFHLDETEFHKNKDPRELQAVTDTQGFQDFMTELRELNWQFSPKSVIQMIGMNAKNMNYYAENIVKHVEIMGQISESIKKLEKTMKKMSKDIPRKK